MAESELAKIRPPCKLKHRVQQEYNSLLVNSLNRIVKSNLSLNNFKWLLTKLERSCARNIIPRSFVIVSPTSPVQSVDAYARSITWQPNEKRLTIFYNVWSSVSLALRAWEPRWKIKVFHLVKHLKKLIGCQGKNSKSSSLLRFKVVNSTFQEECDIPFANQNCTEWSPMKTIMDNCSAVICTFALNCELTALSPTFFLTTYKQVHL